MWAAVKPALLAPLLLFSPTFCISLSTTIAPFQPPTPAPTSGTPRPASSGRAQTPARTDPPSTFDSTIDDELRTLAYKSRHKVPGSDQYRRSWNRWSQTALTTIRSRLADSLRRAADSQLLEPVDQEATDELMFELGVAADLGTMPSFENGGARAGYALNYFCRARLLGDIMFAARTATVVKRRDTNTRNGGGRGDTVGREEGRNNPASFFGDCIDEMLGAGCGDGNVCRIGSLGGGPGYDFVAAALLATRGTCERLAQLEKELGIDDGKMTTNAAAATEEMGRKKSTCTTATAVHATVFEYERGWADIVRHMEGVVQSALGPQHTCDFAVCDITLPLTDPANAAVQAAVGSVPYAMDVWICSYCVAENAMRLRSDEYVFFRQLFEQSRDGVVFVFTETTHRLWPEIIDMALSRCGEGGGNNAGGGFDVAFPRIDRGRGKAGFQLAVRKRAATTLVGSHERELCDRFRRDNDLHERKISGGWVRQKRKVKGAK